MTQLNVISGLKGTEWTHMNIAILCTALEQTEL
jgi:hypothetical protein